MVYVEETNWNAWNEGIVPLAFFYNNFDIIHEKESGRSPKFNLFPRVISSFYSPTAITNNKNEIPASVDNINIAIKPKTIINICIVAQSYLKWNNTVSGNETLVNAWI